MIQGSSIVLRECIYEHLSVSSPASIADGECTRSRLNYELSETGRNRRVYLVNIRELGMIVRRLVLYPSYMRLNVLDWYLLTKLIADTPRKVPSM